MIESKIRLKRWVMSVYEKTSTLNYVSIQSGRGLTKLNGKILKACHTLANSVSMLPIKTVVL